MVGNSVLFMLNHHGRRACILANGLVYRFEDAHRYENSKWPFSEAYPCVCVWGGGKDFMFFGQFLDPLLVVLVHFTISVKFAQRIYRPDPRSLVASKWEKSLVYFVFFRMASSVTTFDSLYDELTKQLRLSGNVKNISDEFSGLKTDQSRAAFTMNLKHVKDVIKVPDLGAAKSNIDALKFKDLGNKQFQKGDYHEAAKLYTKSIAHAPLQNDMNTLSISYANRSAALYHMGFTQRCAIGH